MDRKTYYEYINKIAPLRSNNWLQIEHNSVEYNFYFKEGKLIYASHSVNPSERLERQLKRLSHKIPEIDQKVRNQAHLQFEEINEKSLLAPPEYLTIIWLIKKGLLSRKVSDILVKLLIKEVLESYLLINEFDENKLIKYEHKLIAFCQIDWLNIIEKCQKNLEDWQTLSSQIKSPYQRPYLFTTEQNPKSISVNQLQKLASVLKGFNFLQLAAILNQDELSIAKKLYPLIVSRSIVLRNPQSPYDKLPNFETLLKKVAPSNQPKETVVNTVKQIPKETVLSDISEFDKTSKNYTIVCVDDSPIILQSITKFLNKDNLTIIPINNAAKALIQISRVKPDLILMDIGMPNIDGYQLCSLIRKHSIFAETPIIMVTGNKGLINRAKAKMAGATDYMTKPFSQEDLLTMVFRYLSE